jgi:hypothetical protein
MGPCQAKIPSLNFMGTQLSGTGTTGSIAFEVLRGLLSPCKVPVIQSALRQEVGFELLEQNHGQGRFADSKGLMPIRGLALFASFGFVLTYFSGRFIDSIGLSGFVLQNFRFFFFSFFGNNRGASSEATQSHFSQRQVR